MRFHYITLFISLIFSLLAINLQAGELSNGYYVTYENDTVQVQFDLPMVINGINKKLVNFQEIQCAVPFVNDNKQNAFIKPQDAKLIAFKWDNKQVLMHAKNSSTLKKFKGQKNCRTIFLQQEFNGFLQLYYFYYTHSGPGMQDVGYRKYYLQKENDILFSPKAGVKHFSKEMSEYLADCKYVSNKIAAKELRENDLLQIITDYNSACER